MGGKLFDLGRMPRAGYLERERAMRAYLDGTLDYRIPRYYGDKPDFGDMDVLVAARPDWAEVRARIVADLGIEQTRTVGHVFSTVFRGLQTDFFPVPARYLDAMYDFMSFNDVGNFIGRIARRFGLKYGERGLAWVYRRADGKHAVDLEVCTDFARTCAFLDLDHAAWQAGFATLPDVFAWVIASRYFSVAPYLDETRGDLSRRARVRPTVIRFVEHLRARGVDQRPDYPADPLPVVAAAFPEADLLAAVARERAAEARAVELAARFNGKRVMALTGLTGAALGDFIQRFRAEHDEAWLLATPQAEIDAAIAGALTTERR